MNPRNSLVNDEGNDDETGGEPKVLGELSQENNCRNMHNVHW
jgi:hypothetical protein